MRGFARSKKKTTLKPVQRDLWGDPINEPVNPPAGQGVLRLDFESCGVRLILIDGNPWWVAPDVCRILGHGNTSDAIGRLDDDERGVVNIEGANQHGPTPPVPTAIINEAGVWSLVLTSRKPEAKRFKRWLTHEVLPAIRRTGSYSIHAPSDRVRRTMKRTGCDEQTAVRRLENCDLNKRLHAEAFAAGRGTFHLVEMHNAVYRGQTGREAKALRELVGIGPSATPLDRMGGLALIENTHAKMIGDRICRERGIEPKAQAVIYEITASQIVAEDRAKLGSPHIFAIVEDERRGRVIDLVPAPIVAQAG